MMGLEVVGAAAVMDLHVITKVVHSDDSSGAGGTDVWWKHNWGNTQGVEGHARKEWSIAVT